MQATFLGVEEKEYTNRNTGQKGTEYVLQLHDGDSAKLIRIPQEKFRAFNSITPMSRVEVVFGFADGRFGTHYAVIEEIKQIREPVKS